MTSHAACLIRKKYEWPYSCSAVTAEALKIITAPSRHNPRVTPNSHLSFSKRLGIPPLRVRWIFIRFACFQLLNQSLENATAMLEIRKLVKACASRRQQHNIPGVRGLSREFHCIVERVGARNRHGPINLLLDFLGRRADQQRKNCLFPKRLTELRVVAVFVFAAQNDDYSARKRLQGFQSCIDIRSFRVVVITHPVYFRDKFQTMFHTRKRTNTLGDL